MYYTTTGASTKVKTPTAKHILKGEFPLGEPAIAKSTEYSKEYTKNVLKKDFYLDGKLICKYEG